MYVRKAVAEQTKADPVNATAADGYIVFHKVPGRGILIKEIGKGRVVLFRTEGYPIDEFHPDMIACVMKAVAQKTRILSGRIEQERSVL